MFRWVEVGAAGIGGCDCLECSFRAILKNVSRPKYPARNEKKNCAPKNNPAPASETVHGPRSVRINRARQERREVDLGREAGPGVDPWTRTENAVLVTSRWLSDACETRFLVPAASQLVYFLSTYLVLGRYYCSVSLTDPLLHP